MCLPHNTFHQDNTSSEDEMVEEMNSWAGVHLLWEESVLVCIPPRTALALHILKQKILHRTHSGLWLSYELRSKKPAVAPNAGYQCCRLCLPHCRPRGRTASPNTIVTFLGSNLYSIPDGRLSLPSPSRLPLTNYWPELSRAPTG